MNILVTGSTGFVGQALINRLLSEKSFKIAVSLRGKEGQRINVKSFVVGDLGRDTDWSEALSNVDVVVHLAARVHMMNDNDIPILDVYRKVNTLGTIRLAEQARAAGVRRFIFLSTIKVCGEHTVLGEEFSADSLATDLDPYAQSKREAELGLADISARTGMELVIIRPPLVYGPGVKANFLRMMNWVNKGLPLPLGCIHNKRSLIAIDNLVDLIVFCLNDSSAEGAVLLPSDGEDVSTTVLLKKIGQALDKPARLISVPPVVLTIVFGLLGKKAIANRLLSSLQVDKVMITKQLGWAPPVSMDEALRKTATAFKENEKNV